MSRHSHGNAAPRAARGSVMHDRRIFIAPLPGGWRATATCYHGETGCAHFWGMDHPSLLTAEVTMVDVVRAHERECRARCARYAPVEHVGGEARVGPNGS